MKNVQSLKLPEDEDEIIIPMSNSYLGQDFYDKMSNNILKVQDVVNVPVTLKGLDVEWMFNYKQGYEFLIALSRVENANFLTAASSRIIINYLWGHFKKVILWSVMLPYVIYFVLFLLLVFYNEALMGVVTIIGLDFEKF